MMDYTKDCGKSQVLKNKKSDIIQKYTDKKIFMSSKQVKINLNNSNMSTKTIDRVLSCGECIEALGDEKMEKKKIVKVYDCGNRFCAICSFGKARKEAMIISILMNYISNEYKKEFIFLTLTAPNVSGDLVQDEIKKFNKSFKKMLERKNIDTMNKGYVRKLEITYNKNNKITEKYYNDCKDYCDKKGLSIGNMNPNYDTYHLHFHVILAVNKTYFSDRTYIKQEEWLNIWRECMNDYRITQVDVRRIKDKDNKINLNGNITNAVLEIAKYSAKDTDLHINEDVFNTMYSALKGKQLITFNKLFKDAVKLYKEYKKIKEQDEREKHVLHKYIPQDPTKYVYKLLYQWGKGEYVEKEKIILSDIEKEKFNLDILDNDNIETDI